jgi:hypothetical protein
MKKIVHKIIAIVGLVAVLSPYVAFAFPTTQSAQLVRASSQYFSKSDNALLEPGAAFTTECWIKMTSIVGGGANAYVIASKGTSTGSQRSFVFKVVDNGSSVITLSTQTSSAGTSYDGGTSVTWSATPSNDTWYHVAWVLSGSTERYYVDGTQMGADQTSAISSLFDSTGSIGFGAENISGTPNDFFNGRVALCRVWQVARTQSEIANNRYCVLNATSNLRGQWTLDNELTDSSGNGFTLTNNGSATFGADVPSGNCTASAPTETFYMMLES